jgi:glycosyltransferase involved in cell wall biosynthesis
LNILYVAEGYSAHDYRFVADLRTGGAVSFLPMSPRRLDGRPVPQNVRVLDWVGTRRPFAGFSAYLARAAGLKNLLRRHRPDVILAGPVQTSAFLTALAGGAPLVTMSWGTDLLVDAHRNPVQRAITRWTLRHSAAGFGDCKAVRQAFAYWGMPSSSVVTFPWGITVEDFTKRPAADIRQRLGWEGNTVLICNRSWEPVYAVDVLIKAFAELRSKWPETRLLLVGDGSQKPAIEAMIVRYGLDEYVHRAGRVPNGQMPDYLHAADLYVSPALSDGTSVSLLEAMASGLPVIVTEGYGNVEWVRPGINGWRAIPGDTESMLSNLTAAVAAPLTQRHDMGAANLALVQCRANWSKNFPQLLSLLERVARC